MASVYNHYEDGVLIYSIDTASQHEWRLTTVEGEFSFNPKELPYKLMEYKTLKDENNELISKIDKLRGAKGKQKEHINRLLSKNSNLTNEVTSLRNGRSAPSIKNAQSKHQLKNLEQKDNQIHDLQKVIDLLKHELELLDNTGEDTAAAPYDEIEQLKRERLQFIRRIDELEKENEAISSKPSHPSDAQPFASRPWGVMESKTNVQSDVCNGHSGAPGHYYAGFGSPFDLSRSDALTAPSIASTTNLGFREKGAQRAASDPHSNVWLNVVARAHSLAPTGPTKMHEASVDHFRSPSTRAKRSPGSDREPYSAWYASF